jgi:hypothetical protein
VLPFGITGMPNKGMHLMRSAPATGTVALAGDPLCWADLAGAT